MSGARKTASPAARRSELFDNVKTILAAGLVALGIHCFLFEPFWVPSGSMVPSLLVGDYLVVDKFAYGYSRFSFPFAPDLFSGRIPAGVPKRGDVVVFQPPNPGDTSGDAFVKRVIGLPGDTIQVTNGQLYINGAQVPRADIGGFIDDSSGGPVEAERFSETLPGGRVHAILKLTDDGFANNTPVYTVPAGDVFLMGDNRDNSEDSRFLDGPVGYVPVANVIGKAVMVLGSMNVQQPWYDFWDWPMEFRWNRLFHVIS
jgi:signal peptidase I